MKRLNIKYLGIFACLFLLVGCEYEGIDPITEVDPGQDAASPVVTINNPPEGMVINEATELSSLEINLRVEDDIELKEIVIQVDGEEVATYTEFTDYRIALKKFNIEGLTFGEHTVTVTATDMDGNVTSKTVNFRKEPPYSPKYENEVFYMGFEGNYMDLISLESSEQVGTPAFSNDAVEGTNSYKGANGAHLRIPLAELGDEFSAAFWYKVDATNTRAGILTATDNDDRNQGFRLFREGNATEQRIKLNIGTGTGDSWNDGGFLDVTDGEWVHIAFTVTPTQSVIYFNGEPILTGTMGGAIDWTGVDDLVIASGLNFSGWGHNSDTSLIDELRLFDVALTAEEINEMVNPDGGPLSLYLPFDGDYKDMVSDRAITVVGTPGFAGESVEGTNAYAGATGSYLTFPSTGLLDEEFSTTFWYKVNADPNRAGIITISPEDTQNANYPNVQNKRTSGFRLFRENADGGQRIKLNVGNGTADSWNDGGVISASPGEWVHIAVTVSESETKIYIDGELVNTGSITGGIDWTGADKISVMSGAPRFTEWNHLSDLSYMDELRFYNVVLTQAEIQAEIDEAEVEE